MKAGRLVLLMLGLTLKLGYIYSQDVTAYNSNPYWGSWQPINGFPYLSFRVGYKYENQSSKRQGRPPHVWALEVKNNSKEEISISYKVGNYGESFEQARSTGAFSYIKSGEVRTDYLVFTNTPKGGRLTVYFFQNKKNEENQDGEKTTSKNRWIRYGQETMYKNVISYQLFAARLSWGLGQQFFAANIKNYTSKRIKIKGKLVANLICGNTETSKIDFILKPNETLIKADLGTFNVNFLTDATGLISSADEELCEGKPVMENGKKIGTSRIKSMSISFEEFEYPDEINTENTNTDIQNRKPQVNNHNSTNNGAEVNTSQSSSNSKVGNEVEPEKYDFAKAEAEERKRKAEEKRVNDSIQNELSRKRVENVQKLDKAEDDAFIAAAASVLALGSLMQDEYSDDPIVVRYFLGLGMMEIPLIANTKYSGSTSKTSIEKTSHPTFNLALQATFFNDKFFNINVTPRFIYGLNALSAGVTGDHTVYGGNFEVRAGKKRDSKFKGYLEFGWEKRSGTWEHDFDASTANLGLGFSNLVLESSYDYSVLRYGAGALLDLSDGDKETTIKAGYFFEKPSFFKPSTKPLGVLNIQANLFSFVTVDFSYSVNYAAAGSIKYPSSFSHSNKNFFNLTILKNGLFGH
ncbi:MAG: hypothetical protein K2Y12_02520 [Chitinophagaceae bacterium]|nr:hypothetical protein [Chitinophagaceae bacterium]